MQQCLCRRHRFRNLWVSQKQKNLELQIINYKPKATSAENSHLSTIYSTPRYHQKNHKTLKLHKSMSKFIEITSTSSLLRKVNAIELFFLFNYSLF